jgi:hypothetical protein
MRVFTREQFHDLAWSRPMTELAREFGLSDVALHKICRKHDVPNPPPGWWAKKAAGKKVVVTRLPRLKQGISERIVIVGGELRRECDALSATREKARIRASAAPDAPVDHPLVARTIAALRRARPDHAGLVHSEDSRLIKCAVAPASLDRLEAALQLIVHAASHQGFVLERGDSAAHFIGDEETIGFAIVETFRRVKHELTEKEQADLARWERKAERRRQTGNWDTWFSRPQFAEWDYHPTGQLSFELEHFYGAGSPRRTYRDGKVQRLEDMAGEIAVGIAVLAAAKSEARRQREAELRRQEEQRLLREQALRLKHVEDRRAEALDAILAELADAERLRDLIARLKDSVGDGDPRVVEFIRWGEDRLKHATAALEPAGLAARFGEQRLFGSDDDYAFQPATHFYRP